MSSSAPYTSTNYPQNIQGAVPTGPPGAPNSTYYVVSKNDLESAYTSTPFKVGGFIALLIVLIVIGVYCYWIYTLVHLNKFASFMMHRVENSNFIL